MKILVTGASGMLGRRVVPAIRALGHEVRCLVRKQSVGKLNFPFLVEVCLEEESLQKAVSGCQAIVNLVGIIREFPGRGITFQEVHVEYVDRLLKAAAQEGISRIIHLSAVGASPHTIHPYLRTKYRAEEIIRSGGLDYTIFRPTFMYDRGGVAIETFISQVKNLPVVPVIGDGSYRQQPLFAGDLAQGIAQCLSSGSFTNKTYEAGGPQPFTYNQLLDRIGKALGRERVRKYHLPVQFARRASAVLGQFRFYPLDPDQLELLLMDDICDHRPFFDDFKIRSTSFADGLSTVISDGRA